MKTSRGPKYNFRVLNFFHTYIPPFLGKLTLLSMLPAFLYGCEGPAEAPVPAETFPVSRITVTDDMEGIGTLDIFVFRDDRLQKLDCYQRFDGMASWEGAVVSGCGKRIITAVANSRYERADWIPLKSRSFLKSVPIRLEDERRDCAAMSWETAAELGDSPLRERQNIVLRPYASEIVLNSISCDFTGKPYAGEKISDVRVYLTNVNAECHILEEDGEAPKRIINAGRLNEEDVEGFVRPDLIMQEIKGEIGKRTVYPGISLWCYQSNHPEETPGTPFTRLVIEGKVSGTTYYWPININRDTDGEAGVWRNRRYSYDISIRRKGSTDPDLPINTEDILINMEVAQWKEKEEYSVSF